MMHLSLMKGIAPAYFDAALGVADEGVGSATRSARPSCYAAVSASCRHPWLRREMARVQEEEPMA